MTRCSRFARTANALRSLDPAPPAPLTDTEVHHATAEHARIMAMLDYLRSLPANAQEAAFDARTAPALAPRRRLGRL